MARIFGGPIHARETCRRAHVVGSAKALRTLGLRQPRIRTTTWSHRPGSTEFSAAAGPTLKPCRDPTRMAGSQGKRRAYAFHLSQCQHLAAVRVRSGLVARVPEIRRARSRRPLARAAGRTVCAAGVKTDSFPIPLKTAAYPTGTHRSAAVGDRCAAAPTSSCPDCVPCASSRGPAPTPRERNTL